MNRSVLVVALVILVFISISGSQPIPKTDWAVISEQSASSDCPRIATFSNGDYVVVYGLSQGLSNSLIAFKIFAADGSVKVPETIISPTLGRYYAPNVIVVGDVAVAVWRGILGPPIQCRQFTSDGTTTVATFPINTPSSMLNTNDILGLFAVDNSTFGVTLSPANVTSPIFLYYSTGTTTPLAQLNDTQAADIPAAIYDPRINASFYFVQHFSSYFVLTSYSGYQANPNFARTPDWYTVNDFKYIVPFLTDNPRILGYIVTDVPSNGVRLGILDTQMNTLTAAYGVLFDASTNSKLRPDALPLGSNYALIAQSTVNSSVAYRYVRVNTDSYDLIGPVMTEAPMSSRGVHMAKVGKNIVMAALDGYGSSVVTRVLTFCGNGVLDFDEQCDASSGCSADCTCQYGTLAKGGLCLDICGNGIVTGNEDCDGTTGCDPVTCKCQAGYQPYVVQQQCRLVPVDFVPKVGPSLDCLIINSANNTLDLFFSFVSSDSFDQTIPFGTMNDFSPAELATDRPTFFPTGTSLTYPVSPYNLTVSRSVNQFTWLLGSYNLTVDASGNKADALQCPKNAGFVITVATFDTLSDADVRQLLVNIAHKYNISIDRLDATYRLSTPGSATEPNIYSISVTLLASMNSSEPSAQDVLKELFSDLKDSKDQLSSDLTQGLSEKNPQIKNVTPNPTGVEVRGQQRDVAPTAEPTATSGASSFYQFYFALCMTVLLWGLATDPENSVEGN